MILPRILDKLHGFVRLRAIEKAWLLPVWLLLGASRLAVLTVPFRFLASGLGLPAGTTSCVPLLSLHEQQEALWIGRVVRVASNYTPWQSNCLAQALTARILLSLYRIPYSFFLGVMNEAAETGPRKLKAHAWVSAGKIRVTGGDGFREFAVVECFVNMLPRVD